MWPLLTVKSVYLNTRICCGLFLENNYSNDVNCAFTHLVSWCGVSLFWVDKIVLSLFYYLPFLRARAAESIKRAIKQSSIGREGLSFIGGKSVDDKVA